MLVLALVVPRAERVKLVIDRRRVDASAVRRRGIGRIRRLIIRRTIYGKRRIPVVLIRINIRGPPVLVVCVLEHREVLLANEDVEFALFVFFMGQEQGFTVFELSLFTMGQHGFTVFIQKKLFVAIPAIPIAILRPFLPCSCKRSPSSKSPPPSPSKLRRRRQPAPHRLTHLRPILAVALDAAVTTFQYLRTPATRRTPARTRPASTEPFFDGTRCR